MPGEEETDFTIVDRRRVSDSADVEPADAPAESQEAATAESPEAAPVAEDSRQSHRSPFQVPHLSIADRIVLCVNWLQEGAWIALGLVRDPATDKIEQNLEAARTAIDCVALLVSKAEPDLDETTRRELQNLVRDLRLNFVQQQTRSQ